MPKQEKRADKRKGPEQKEKDVSPNPEVIEKGKKIKEDMDKILDEIDDVLEENAEEFVKNFVQKGGE
ncbi:MAG: ubiquitin-like protein Pup [Nitrospirota bacterium]